MNRYYIRQKVFSWRDKFSVKDENGEDVFHVEGEIISLGKKLHMYDPQGREVFYIAQKIMSFRPSYEIWSGNNLIAKVTKRITLFTPEYYVEGPGWSVEGSLGAHNYRINGNNGTVAVVRKAWFSWGDSYEISVGKEVNAKLALAVVIVIDAVLASENDSAAFSTSY